MTDFKAAVDDYVILPGISSHDFVDYVIDGADTIVKVTVDRFSPVTGVLKGIALAKNPGITDARVIVGSLADKVNVDTNNIDAFLNDPFMLDGFGILIKDSILSKPLILSAIASRVFQPGVAL